MYDLIQSAKEMLGPTNEETKTEKVKSLTKGHTNSFRARLVWQWLMLALQHVDYITKTSMCGLMCFLVFFVAADAVVSILKRKLEACFKDTLA